MGSQSIYKAICLKNHLVHKKYSRGESTRWYKQYCKNYANGFISESDKQLIEKL